MIRAEPSSESPRSALVPSVPRPRIAARSHGSRRSPPGTAIPGFEMLPDEPPQGLVRRFITDPAAPGRPRRSAPWWRTSAQDQVERRGGGVPARPSPGAAGRLAGAAVPRPVNRRTGPSPSSSAAAWRSSGRPTSSSARSSPCARTSSPRRSPTSSRTSSTACRWSPSTATWRLIEDGPRAADRLHVLLGRPDPHRLGLDRPDPPRHHARRRLGDPQGGEAGNPRDAAPATPSCCACSAPSSSSSSPATGPSSSSASSWSTPAARSTCGARRTTPRPSPPTSSTCRTWCSRAIYRQYSGSRVLCMEFLKGYKPSAPETQELTRRGARPAGRPRRREHHPHAVQGRLLPRRPAPGQPADPPRPASSASSTSAWSAASTTTCGAPSSTTTTRW